MTIDIERIETDIHNLQQALYTILYALDDEDNLSESTKRAVSWALEQI